MTAVHEEGSIKREMPKHWQRHSLTSAEFVLPQLSFTTAACARDPAGGLGNVSAACRTAAQQMV